MSTGLKANSDGSAAIQVGGTDVITLTSGGAATFVTSPTTVQAGTAAAPSITFSGDTNTGIYSPGADTVGLTAGGTLVGSVGLGTTLALQGASSQSGTGITFPATQSASSNANTLDDYEEGTFTITGQDQSGNGFPGYTARTAYYTKIGRLVHVTIYLRTDGTTTGMTTGQQLKITGLPFTPLNNTVNYVHAAAFLTALAPGTYFELLAAQNGTSLDIYSTGRDAAAPYDPTAFTVANFENGNGAGININFAYPIA